MMKGGHGQTNQLHDINWGAVHASHAPILNYYVCVCVCMVLLIKFNSVIYSGWHLGDYV